MVDDGEYINVLSARRLIIKAALPADSCVWLSSPEAAFTAKKYLFANWDVNELKDRAEKISGGTLLEMWPDELDYRHESRQ